LREMGGISRYLLANRTGESILTSYWWRAQRHFLRRASKQSGFHDSLGRMQCDHKPMMRRKLP